LDGNATGLGAESGEAFAHAWFAELAPIFHLAGDFYPLFMLRTDGSEGKVGLRRADGSVVILTVAPIRDEDGVAWVFKEIVQR